MRLARGEAIWKNLCQPELGSGSGNLFMGIYAAKSRKWMKKTDAEPADFARVCVKSRRAGSLSPLAQFRKGTSIEEVLSNVWPVIHRLSSCVPLSVMVQPRF